LGISPQEIQTNLLFTTDKIGNTMSVAMKPDDAKSWFGTAPPDLSVEARARGRDWIYTYLRSFYRDDTRPTGWNNLVYENVSMPTCCGSFKGNVRRSSTMSTDERSGETEHKFVGYQQVTPGTMSAVDYDSDVADLVSYLSWMSEPTQQTRNQPWRVGAAVPRRPELFRMAIERCVLERYQIITPWLAWGQRKEKPAGRFFRVAGPSAF
jgi:ubiquinol-cytochrome c reductase cytochrome c1 subunit